MNPYQTYQQHRTFAFTRVDMVLALYDAAIERLDKARLALESNDEAAAQAPLLRAQRIVADQVPLIALEYPESWALSRSGLLGAGDTGLGITRYAGLAWAP